jgi:hypothetical protein
MPLFRRQQMQQQGMRWLGHQLVAREEQPVATRQAAKPGAVWVDPKRTMNGGVVPHHQAPASGRNEGGGAESGYRYGRFRLQRALIKSRGAADGAGGSPIESGSSIGEGGW